MNRRSLGGAFLALLLVAILFYLFAPRSDRSEVPAGAGNLPTRQPRPLAGGRALQDSRDGAAPLESERPQPSRLRREPGYDTKTVETVRGRLVSSGPAGRTMNRVILETAKETLSVKLGPPRFVESLGLKLEPGDEIDVTGSRIERPGRSIIVAATVSKRGRTYRIRDDSGRPAWGEAPGTSDDSGATAETDP